MSTLLLATRSADKLREIRALLVDIEGLAVVDLGAVGVPETLEEEEIERHATFEENALAKATYFRAQTGLATVADDSGLAVDELGGRPGVRSKRFAPQGAALAGRDRDEANNRHLLELLAGLPPSRRRARYVCVAALADAEGTARLLPGAERELVFRGEAEGIIVEEPRGDGGFGYDPLFFDPELGRTFAEIGRDEKSARSHRGAAFRALADRLRARRP